MAERFVWTPPAGAAIDLSDDAAGYRVLAAGTRGLNNVTYEMATERHAGTDGTTVQAVTANPNEPTLGLMVQADSETELRGKVRGLVRAMRPKAGAGRLTVTSDDGDSRTLTCYAVGGLEGDESPDTTLAGAWWKAALKLYAADPYWYGAETSVTWSLVDLPAFFPLPPMQLAASTITGQKTITNLGDEDAFPVWTITGPGVAPELVNTTTGRSIALDLTLAEGDAVHIDTRPGYQSVRDGDGTNLFGALTTDPALWVLEPGANSVAVLMDDVGAASSVTAYYSPRFAGI